jgi:hypothetical protein
MGPIFTPAFVDLNAEDETSVHVLPSVLYWTFQSAGAVLEPLDHRLRFKVSYCRVEKEITHPEGGFAASPKDHLLLEAA